MSAQPQSTIFVLFGASGDLAWRKIVPALFDLWVQDQLPERFALLGTGRSSMSHKALRERFRDGVAHNARVGAADDEQWQRFARLVRYQSSDVEKPDGLDALYDAITEQEAQWDVAPARVFYLATPPSLFAPAARALRTKGLTTPRERARLVVEKPLGHDLASFRDINRAICGCFEENQVFRIDHYLGKETVQNLTALRFANPIFEPLWNRHYVDHVAVTVAETAGVGTRAGYYEHAGALRDMVQNHLFQLLCLIAMEPPVSYSPEDLRNKKMDVLEAVRPLAPEAAARGQYAPGVIGSQRVPGYRDEEGVAQCSNTETFAALKLYIDNWRWQGVPFYLRTGKRLAADVSEISIRFRDVPHCFFPECVGLNEQTARLVIQIQPEQGIVLKFAAKEPGYRFHLRPVNMHFSYRDAFDVNFPEAYETLLRDILRGDPTLFMRADQVEAAWRLIMPILEEWEGKPATDFPNYQAGFWGPESAELLVARDGRSWLAPTLDLSGHGPCLPGNNGEEA